MDVSLEASGMDEALKGLDPLLVRKALVLWFDRGTAYVKREMQTRAPRRLRGKVRIIGDNLPTPKWARIYVKSPLAHLIEGGTGGQGAGGFQHVARHWPSTEGIMRATGLPKPEAFLVARAIGMRGGNPPRPFIRPTFEATKGELGAMALAAVVEVMTP